MSKADYQKVIGKYEGLTQRTKDLQYRIKASIVQCEQIESSVDALFGFGSWINTVVKDKLESIANTALKSIFPDKEMFFRVVPNKTKKGLFYDLYIETNGVPTELLDAKGGGVLDVIQMCLRITYVSRLKGKLRQTILLDEPFKNLDAERVNLASQWLDQISKRLKIQFLIITHIPALILTVENSGRIEVRYADNKSEVIQ
jgi:hypothetical protein